VLNAISDALGGVEVQVPATAEQIWKILQES
jgi:hypothetical protein